MSGEGQSFLLPPSGLDQIMNIEDWSNTDVPGLWIYKIGHLDMLGNVEGPEKGVRQGEWSCRANCTARQEYNHIKPAKTV